MNKYLLLYRSQQTAGEQMGASPEEQEAGMQAWFAWFGAVGDALVDGGSPTQPVTKGDPGPAGWVGGYSIVQADSDEAVMALLDGHPHTAMGGTIDVLQLLPMPGM